MRETREIGRLNLTSLRARLDTPLCPKRNLNFYPGRGGRAVKTITGVKNCCIQYFLPLPPLRITMSCRCGSLKYSMVGSAHTRTRQRFAPGPRHKVTSRAAPARPPSRLPGRALRELQPAWQPASMATGENRRAGPAPAAAAEPPTASRAAYAGGCATSGRHRARLRARFRGIMAQH